MKIIEKRKPHYPLTLVQSMAREGKIRATTSAFAGSYALVLNFAEMVGIVMRLASKDFYRSMTTYADHKTWQDVYRPMTKAGEVYLKLTVIDDVRIVSFKEL